jgi:hypothetical protein
MSAAIAGALTTSAAINNPLATANRMTPPLAWRNSNAHKTLTEESLVDRAILATGPRQSPSNIARMRLLRNCRGARQLIERHTLHGGLASGLADGADTDRHSGATIYPQRGPSGFAPRLRHDSPPSAARPARPQDLSQIPPTQSARPSPARVTRHFAASIPHFSIDRAREPMPMT